MGERPDEDPWGVEIAYSKVNAVFSIFPIMRIHTYTHFDYVDIRSQGTHTKGRNHYEQAVSHICDACLRVLRACANVIYIYI